MKSIPPHMFRALLFAGAQTHTVSAPTLDETIVAYRKKKNWLGHCTETWFRRVGLDWESIAKPQAA